jgi:hypothetical protein
MNPTWFMAWFVARLEGFEPPAYGLEVRSSIHLSYRRLIAKYTTPLAFRQGQFSWGFPSILHSPTCRPRRLNSCRKPLLTPFRFFITYAKK